MASLDQYTPQTDGVFYMYIASASAGRTFVYVNDAALGRVIGIQDITAVAINVAATVNVEATKGRTYNFGRYNMLAGSDNSIFVPYL